MSMAIPLLIVCLCFPRIAILRDMFVTKYFKKILLQKKHIRHCLIGAFSKSIAAVVHELYAGNKNTKQLIMAVIVCNMWTIAKKDIGM